MPPEGPSAGLAGTTVGHYRIESLIGRGGMGEVYLASDLKLRRKVAIKVLPDHLATEPNARARFVRECRLACKVVNPYVATVFDVVEHAERPLIVMERIEGDRLDRWCRNEAPTPRELAGVGLEITEALAAIHRAGIVHRDLKPGNVMITPDGHVKVTDFGVALPTPGLPDDMSTIPADEADPVTRTGVGVGTVAYMSPEQIRGGPIDGRSDLFSLGVVLYEAVTGEHPFRRDTLLGTASAILHDPPSAGHDHPTLTGSGPLRDVILRLLEKSPALRYRSAEALAGDLRAVVRGEALAPRPRTPFRWKRAAAVAGIVAAVGVGGWLVLKGRGDGGGGGAPARPVIAVLPFSDETGEPDGRARAGMVADLLGRTLSQTRRLRAVDPERLGDVIGGAAGAADALARVARNVPVAWIASGRLYREGERWLAAVDLFRPGESEPVESVRVEAPMASTLADLAAGRVIAALFPDAQAAGEVPRMAGWTSDDDEALIAFRDGMAARRELRLGEAILLLERAASLDPGFLLARIEWASALDASGHQGRAQRIAVEALRGAGELPGAPGERLRHLAAAVDARAREQAGDEVTARRGFAERSPDDPVAFLALADAHRRIGQWDDATAALDRAEALDASDPRVPLARARLAHSRGESAKADETAMRAVDRLATLGSAVGRAVALKLRGEIAFATGRYDDAERYYGEAERSCKDGGLADLSRAIGTGIADCKLARGDLGEAERLYREAIAAAKRLGDSRTVVVSLGNLGGALYSSGRLDVAESVLREAIAEGRSIENAGITLGARLNLASLMAYQGRVAESKTLSESALQIARDANDARRESMALLFLADAEFQQGLFPESVRHYDELIASQRGAGAPPRDLGNTLFARGWVLASVGRTGEAMAALDEALEIQRKLEEMIPVAYALVIRSEVYAQWGDWDAAGRDLAEARKIGSTLEPPNPDLAAQADLAEARLELMRERFPEARGILDGLRARATGTEAIQVAAGALAASCEALVASGESEKAARLAQECLEDGRAMEIDRLRAKVCLARAEAEPGPQASLTMARSVLDQAERSGAQWIAATAAAASPREEDRDRGLRALDGYVEAAPQTRRSAVDRRPDLVRVRDRLTHGERGTE